VIVNVPSPSAAPANVAPTNVTNINVPPGSYPTPTDGSVANAGATQGQNLPAINYSPMLPAQTGYPSAATSGAPPANYIPPTVYGTAPNGVPNTPPATYTPPVGNGSIPGSTPNPSLPNNNGLVGSTPTPGQPNGAPNVGASPSLPSGFSAP